MSQTFTPHGDTFVFADRTDEDGAGKSDEYQGQSKSASDDGDNTNLDGFIRMAFVGQDAGAEQPPHDPGDLII